MPSVSVVAPGSTLRADAVVVGLRTGPDGPQLLPGAEAVDEALQGRLLAGLRFLGATGKAEEVLKLATLGRADFPLVVAAGVGPGADDPESLRRAIGAACRQLAASRRVHLAVDAPARPLPDGAPPGAHAHAAYQPHPPT